MTPITPEAFKKLEERGGPLFKRAMAALRDRGATAISEGPGFADNEAHTASREEAVAIMLGQTAARLPVMPDGFLLSLLLVVLSGMKVGAVVAPEDRLILSLAAAQILGRAYAGGMVTIEEQRIELVLYCLMNREKLQ